MKFIMDVSFSFEKVTGDIASNYQHHTTMVILVPYELQFYHKSKSINITIQLLRYTLKI